MGAIIGENGFGRIPKLAVIIGKIGHACL